MTDPELEGLARQALNMMRHDIERKRFNFLLALYIEGEGLRRLRKVETLVIERLGENWLNHGARKDIGFGMLKFACAMFHPQAIIVGTAANVFKTTPAFAKLPVAEQDRLLHHTGHDEHHRMVERGLLTLEDALVVTVQTEIRVAVCRAVNGKPLAITFGAQSEYDGRTKLYGDPAEAQAELAKLFTSLEPLQ